MFLEDLYNHFVRKKSYPFRWALLQRHKGLLYGAPVRRLPPRPLGCARPVTRGLPFPLAGSTMTATAPLELEGVILA